MTIGVFIIVSLILTRSVYNAIKNASVQYEDESGFYETDEYSILLTEKDKKIAA